MARVVIPRQVLNSVYDSPAYQTLVWTTLDNTNGNYIKIAGGELLQFRGSGEILIITTTDPYGRTDGSGVLFTVSGSNIIVVGPVLPVGFVQPDGSIYINSDGSLEAAFVALAR